LGSLTGSDMQRITLRLRLISSFVLRVGWSDDYSHFFHGGLMTSNHGFEINAIDSKPIELLLAGGRVLALFQSLAHVRFVFYYGPIISQRNQLF